MFCIKIVNKLLDAYPKCLIISIYNMIGIVFMIWLSIIELVIEAALYPIYLLVRFGYNHITKENKSC